MRKGLLPDIVLVELALEQRDIPGHPLLEGSNIRPTLQLMSPVYVVWDAGGGWVERVLSTG